MYFYQVSLIHGRLEIFQWRFQWGARDATFWVEILSFSCNFQQKSYQTQVGASLYEILVPPLDCESQWNLLTCNDLVCVVFLQPAVYRSRGINERGCSILFLIWVEEHLDLVGAVALGFSIPQVRASVVLIFKTTLSFKLVTQTSRL